MAFDIIGSREKAVAIIENKKMLNRILEEHKNVKSVLLKTSPRKGKYRNYKYKLLWGEKNTEVIHAEYGYRIKVDPRKAYFSPRESTERQRIVDIVKNNENILIMFSGVGPISVAINRRKNCRITNVEINPKAVRYANDNVKLNKLYGVKNIKGDIKKIKLNEKFDRIFMPLPETGYKFIDTALKFSKKGTIIHLYGFDDKKIKEIIKKNKKIKLIKINQILPYGPGIWKTRYDIKVL